MGYPQLGDMIDELERSISKAIGGAYAWGGVWKVIREIDSLFRETRFSTKFEREIFWQRFQNLVLQVKEQAATDRITRERAATEALERIRELEQDVERALSGTASWPNIWQTIKETRRVLNRTRFPSKEGKEEALRYLDNIVMKIKDNRQQQEAQSKEHVAAILNHLELQLPGILELLALPILLPINAIDGLLHHILGLKYDPEKERLEALSRDLQKAWGEFNERKDEMLGRDKKAVFETLKRIEEELNEAWERRRQTQRGRIELRIAEREVELEGLYGRLQHREEHRSKLQNMLAEARSDEYYARVEDWLSEEEDRINGLQIKISKLEKWLEEDRGKIIR